MPDVEALLKRMVGEKASDLFLTEGRPPSMRVNGKLTALGDAALEHETLKEFMHAVLRPTQREPSTAWATSTWGVSRPGLGRFRVHFHLQRGLLGAVMRLVPGGQLDFDVLGLPDAVGTLAESPRGLVLVTGSTGSGKSTTLAAMVHHINTRYASTSSPSKTPSSSCTTTSRPSSRSARWAATRATSPVALRHVVRESPDVILIGEMRDAETMNVALSAALTGHLVLSQRAHHRRARRPSSASSAYYPEHLREQVCMDLSLCLQGIVAQRLVPRADGEGRVAAVEVMVATPPVRKLIREQRVDEVEDLMLHLGTGCRPSTGRWCSSTRRAS
jgi:twitching motility protein PilT